MKITTKYDIGDSVYLVTDSEQYERIIVSISIHPNNLIMYSMMCGVEASDHYEFEISDKIDIMRKTSN